MEALNAQIPAKNVVNGISQDNDRISQGNENVALENENKGNTESVTNSNADGFDSENGINGAGDVLNDANNGGGVSDSVSSTANNSDYINKIEAKIKELEEREITRLGDDYRAFLIWCRRRETLSPNDDLFYAYEEAWNRARAIVNPLRDYIVGTLYKDVLFSIGLHYIITEPFTFTDAEGQTQENPLYKKHKIEGKAYLISSASDESSSSSVHITNSLQNGDFLMQDLLRTRYGTWAYTILEQLDIGATLL